MSSSREALDLVRSYFSQTDAPANVVDSDPIGLGTDLALGYESTLGLVSVTDDDDWLLSVTAGLAIEIPDFEGCLQWVNVANRGSATGRFYCTLAQAEPKAAIVHEANVHGQWVDLACGLSRRRLLSTVYNAMVSASGGTSAVLDALGGQRFEPEWAMTTLMAIRG